MSSSLGRQIAHYRKRAGLSQKDLAAVVGISSAALSQYESGKREPNLLIITSLARALNTTIDALLGLEPLSDLTAQNRGEYALLRHFRGLNALGQKRILGDIAGLEELPKYSKHEISRKLSEPNKNLALRRGRRPAAHAKR